MRYRSVYFFVLFVVLFRSWQNWDFTFWKKQKSECDIYAPASVNQSLSQPKSQKAGHQQQQKEQKQLSSDSKAADQQKEDCQNDPQHVER